MRRRKIDAVTAQTSNLVVKMRDDFRRRLREEKYVDVGEIWELIADANRGTEKRVKRVMITP